MNESVESPELRTSEAARRGADDRSCVMQWVAWLAVAAGLAGVLAVEVIAPQLLGGRALALAAQETLAQVDLQAARILLAGLACAWLVHLGWRTLGVAVLLVGLIGLPALLLNHFGPAP